MCWDLGRHLPGPGPASVSVQSRARLRLLGKPCLGVAGLRLGGCHLGLGWVVLGKCHSPPSSPSSLHLPSLSYIGDCEISVELQKIQAGVNGIQVGGAWQDCPPFLPWGWGQGSGQQAANGDSSGLSRLQLVQDKGAPKSLTGPSVPVQLQGTLRVILDPLLVDKPFVGAVTVFFLQKPVSPVVRGRPAAPCE